RRSWRWAASWIRRWAPRCASACARATTSRPGAPAPAGARAACASTTRTCRPSSTSPTRTASRCRRSSDARPPSLGGRGPGLELELPVVELGVREPVDPVAEHEELAAALAPLVGVVEVPDQHAVEPFREARQRDLAPQALGLERGLAA